MMVCRRFRLLKPEAGRSTLGLWDFDTEAGMHSKAGFKITLIKRFGSLFAAWHKGLDLDDNGRLTFNEFCQASRRLGVEGNFNLLWAELDYQDNGSLEFVDLDPETAFMFQEFRDKAEEAYGNMLLAWMHGLDA